MLLVVIVFFLLLLSGMPVAFAIAISGLMFFLQNLGLPITIPIQRTISMTQNFPLLAVPLFILAGNLMNGAGITKRLLDLSYILTRKMRGGVAQVSAVLSTLMGGVSGSCIADAAMETRMLGPEMLKRGYSKGFAVNVNVWTSLITPIIPPGIGFILYGTIGQVSVGRLFAGGIVPGVLLMVFYMFAISLTARIKGYDSEKKKRSTFKELIFSVYHSFWALIFPLVLLMTMRFGVFTPSEVGSFAVIYALIVGFLAYQEMTWKDFMSFSKNSLADIGAVMFLIALSGIFDYGIIYDRIPEKIANFLLGISTNPNFIMIIIMGFLVIAGMFIDGAVLILMLTSIFLPIATKVGFDPVHFGLIFVLTITVGNMTPPVGAAMYASCSILDCSLEEYIKESIPFFIVTLLAILVLTIFPQITLFIPNLLFGK